MSEPNPEKPQLFVDEDWKSRVEAEKEAAAKVGPAATPAPTASVPSETPSGDSGPRLAEDEQSAQLPPASLAFLVATLGSQALVALGQIPSPFTGKAEVRLPEARHFIDTLGMLEEKTVGNRTPEESAILRDYLYQLRLLFVDAQEKKS